jgi:ABC-type transport system involved in cytochrome c biogenesis permease component
MTFPMMSFFLKVEEYSNKRKTLRKFMNNNHKLPRCIETMAVKKRPVRDMSMCKSMAHRLLTVLPMIILSGLLIKSMSMSK